MVTSFLNHLSLQLPDEKQLRNNLDLIYRQARDRVKIDLHRALATNAGSALTCDSQERGTCVMSVYYIDAEWKLTEAVLAATGAPALDVNRFVSQTLETYQLAERDRLHKFTFVSHGSQLGDLSQCLRSMGHIVDRVVDEAIDTFDKAEDGALAKLFEQCQAVVSKVSWENVTTSTEHWTGKQDLLKLVHKYRESILGDDDEHGLDFDLISELSDLLESFRTASSELRKCQHHPTLCHVLLYYYKLKKVLSTASPTPSTTTAAAANNNKTKNDKSLSSGGISPSSTAAEPLKVTDKVASSSIDSTGDAFDSDAEKDLDEEEEKAKRAKLDAKANDDDDNDEEKMEVEEKENEDESVPHKATTTNKVSLEQLKKCLLDSLQQHYKVESLHRVATFLWPNFRFLKMLPAAEQKEVHAEVRRLLQAHCQEIVSPKGAKAGEPNANNKNSLHNGSCGNGSGEETETNKSRSEFDEWEVEQEEPDDDQDEVDKYLSMQLSSTTEGNILAWWRQHSHDFPQLSHLVKWVLSIPASVTSRERYNLGGEVTTDHRFAVDDHTLFLHCNL